MRHANIIVESHEPVWLYLTLILTTIDIKFTKHSIYPWFCLVKFNVLNKQQFKLVNVKEEKREVVVAIPITRRKVLIWDPHSQVRAL